MDLAAWISGRERAALRGVHLLGLFLCGALLLAAGWLGWREARLPGMSSAEVGMGDQMAAETRLRLKQLSLVIYLAKVRQDSLSMAITGRFDVDVPCLDAGTLTGLADDSACVSLWKQSLRRLWSAAFGEHAPPIPSELERDLWGAPYVLGQSEAACGHFGAWCPEDTISSVGPDGKPNTPDDIRETVPQHLGPAAAAKAAQ